MELDRIQELSKPHLVEAIARGEISFSSAVMLLARDLIQPPDYIDRMKIVRDELGEPVLRRRAEIQAEKEKEKERLNEQ